MASAASLCEENCSSLRCAVNTCKDGVTYYGCTGECFEKPDGTGTCFVPPSVCGCGEDECEADDGQCFPVSDDDCTSGCYFRDPEYPSKCTKPEPVVPTECGEDADCGEGEFCRECDPDGSSASRCAAYALEGESCGGFTLCENADRCRPDLTCLDLYPIMADEPGTCSSCDQEDATNCALGHGNFDVHICECFAPADPCETMECDPGLTCRQVQCFAAPCPLVAECVPADPCATMDCGPGSTCERIAVPCQQPPCPYVGECVSDDPCATFKCELGSTCKVEEVQVPCFGFDVGPFGGRACPPQRLPRCVNVCDKVWCGPRKFCRPACDGEGAVTGAECVRYSKAGGDCGRQGQCGERRCKGRFFCDAEAGELGVCDGCSKARRQYCQDIGVDMDPNTCKCNFRSYFEFLFN